MENIFQFHGDENVSNIAEQIQKWISTLEFDMLLKMFGKERIHGQSLKDQIRELMEFSSIWDFRGKQKKGDIENARWTVENYGFSEQQKDIIMKAANKLGLVGGTMPSKKEYDYVFVLGGARMSCLFRMKYAKQICDIYGIKAKYVVGLAGLREVMDSERNATDIYAPKAKTEFDLMRAALFDVFEGVQLRDKEEYNNQNLNNSWVVEKYCFEDMPIILLAAPSGEPQMRRANTADTFTFFVERFKVENGSNILLVTSQIYVPYQQLEAIRILGIPHKHSLETIGFPNEWSASLQGLQKPENYLQEIRSVLQSVGRLYELG